MRKSKINVDIEVVTFDDGRKEITVRYANYETLDGDLQPVSMGGDSCETLEEAIEVLRKLAT